MRVAIVGYIFCATLFGQSLVAQKSKAPEKGIQPQAPVARTSSDGHQSEPSSPSATSIPIVEAAPNKPRETSGIPGEGQQRTTAWTEKVNAYSTLAIALISLLTLAGLGLQITATRNTERAWVIVNPIELAPPIGFIPSKDTGNIENRLVGVNQRTVFSCALKNTGNTPAILSDFALHYMTAKSMSEIPSEPEYGPFEDLNGLTLVKGDSTGFDTELEPNSLLTKPEWDSVHQAGMVLYAFGIVTYSDVYNRRHETRFGYLYHFPKGGDRKERGFRRELLPTAYNSAT